VLALKASHATEVASRATSFAGGAGDDFHRPARGLVRVFRRLRVVVFSVFGAWGGALGNAVSFPVSRCFGGGGLGFEAGGYGA